MGSVKPTFLGCILPLGFVPMGVVSGSCGFPCGTLCGKGGGCRAAFLMIS